MKTFNRIAWTAIIALTGFLVIDGIVNAVNENSDPNYLTGSITATSDPNSFVGIGLWEPIKYNCKTHGVIDSVITMCGDGRSACVECFFVLLPPVERVE